MLNQAMTYMCKSIGSLKGDQNIPVLSTNQNYCKVEWDLHQCAESEKWKLFLFCIYHNPTKSTYPPPHSF